ncbi:MAG: alpha/beta hydrolase [Clostridia bacterium]|nr:alpha/beta hydrolase [Clostridia bacterium]
MRILDAVIDYFHINTENIMCTGNSGGGTATYYFACMDERIAVAVPSCAVCTYESSIAAMFHCMCNHIPSIRKYFEMGDLAALIVPRKLLISAGEKDPIFPIAGVRKTFETIQEIYTLAGAAEQCALITGDGGHFYYADLIWPKLREMGV